VGGDTASFFATEGMRAEDVYLCSPGGVAVEKDGCSVLAGDGCDDKIFRVSCDGRLTTFAGIGQPNGPAGDGAPATQGNIGVPHGIAVAPSGDVYFTTREQDEYQSVQGIRALRKVSPGGILSTVVGRNSGVLQFDEGAAIGGVPYDRPAGIAVGHDGAVFYADVIGMVVRRAASPLPGFGLGDVVVPSEDGREVYHFDPEGRHLETRNALTGAPLLQFAYDSAGRLSGVTDFYGNQTQIERDGGGAPTAIVAPFGHRTELSVDGEGNLASITDPAGEAVLLAADAGGLLQSIQGATGNLYRFEYDGGGRLERAFDPTNAKTQIARTVTSTSIATAITSPLGRVAHLLTEFLPDGGRRRTITSTSGTTSVVLEASDGTRTATRPDGTVVTVELGPDPRFGLLSPIVARRDTELPSGTRRTEVGSRAATVATPGDPLSLTTLTETVAVNSREGDFGCTPEDAAENGCDPGDPGQVTTASWDAGPSRWTVSSAAGRQSRLTIDGAGNPLLAESPGVAATSFSYDPQGRLVQTSQGVPPDDRVTTIDYGADGLPSLVTNAELQSIGFSRDLAGRVVSKLLPDGQIFGYRYDADGALLGVTPPGRPEHGMGPDARGLETTYVAPDVGAGAAPAVAVIDPDRRLTRVDRAAGAV